MYVSSWRARSCRLRLRELIRRSRIWHSQLGHLVALLSFVRPVGDGLLLHGKHEARPGEFSEQ